MLTELYVEALPVDENLADRVWHMWVLAIIDEELAMTAWLLIVTSFAEQRCRRG